MKRDQHRYGVCESRKVVKEVATTDGIDVNQIRGKGALKL